MLGVEDKFNLCLLPFDSVVVVCQAIIRYIFIPLIQIETPEFRSMVEPLFKGLSQFMPHMTYDLQMFTAKRLLGIPGYQFASDIYKETVCRQLFTPLEIVELREHIFRNTGVEYKDITFCEAIPIINVRSERISLHSFDTIQDENLNIISKSAPLKSDPIPQLLKLLNLDSADHLDLHFIDPDAVDWKSQLNDSQFHKLSHRDQIVLKTRFRLMRACEYRVVRFFCETGLSFVLYLMRKWYHSKQATVVLKKG